MNPEYLNAMHRNPDHWHFVFFYYAPEDPRIVVKKRRGIGWTLNFARPLAIPFFVSLIASAYGYMNLLSLFDISESSKWMGIFLLIVLIVFLCGWMSHPRRYIRKARTTNGVDNVP